MPRPSNRDRVMRVLEGSPKFRATIVEITRALKWKLATTTALVRLMVDEGLITLNRQGVVGKKRKPPTARPKADPRQLELFEVNGQVIVHPSNETANGLTLGVAALTLGDVRCPPRGAVAYSTDASVDVVADPPRPYYPSPVALNLVEATPAGSELEETNAD